MALTGNQKALDNSTNTSPQPPVAADVAPELEQLLDRMEAIIPDYTHPDRTRRSRVSANARFADQLIAPTISAMNAYAPFSSRNLFDIGAGRAALDYRDSLRPIALRLAAITLSLSYSIDDKLATSGQEALQVYHWAKRHAKQPDGGGAQTYVDEMTRVVARTVNRRPKSRTPDTTPTAPPSNTPSQGFLSGSASSAEPDDDEIFDRVREVAKSDPRE
jgi:hypothetical protein